MEQDTTSSTLRGIKMLGLLIVIGTFGFMIIEGWSFFDSFYMTMITISTVGYGETRELHPIGRLFTVGLIVAGIATTAYTFTLLGRAVFEGELSQALGRLRMRKDYDKLKDHYIVCGYGRVGSVVVEGLQKEGIPFVIIDHNNEKAALFHEKNYIHAVGDASDEALLTAVGIERARGVLALLPSDAENLYLVMTAKELAPNITAIARAVDFRAEVRLRRAGADRVVSPYRIAGTRVLNAALRPALVEFMDLWTDQSQMHINLEELRVSEGSIFVGKSLGEARIRQDYGVIIVSIKREDPANEAAGRSVFNPGADERLRLDDILVVIGDVRHVDTLAAACNDKRERSHTPASSGLSGDDVMPGL